MANRFQLISALLLASLVAALARPIIDDVSSKASKACKALNSTAACNANETCAWCASSLGTPGCFPTIAAQFLPPMIFTCDKVDQMDLSAQAVPAASSPALSLTKFTCGLHLSSDACDTAPQCTWCNSQFTGTGCYPAIAAQFLPSMIFTCDKKDEPVDLGKLGLGCKHLLNSTACDANTNCSWCSNTLGMPGCYPTIAAQFLPKMIFTCDKVDAPVARPATELAAAAPAVDLAKFGCKALITGTACSANANCSWCDSMFNGTGCYPAIAAQFLPPMIFTCAKKAASVSLPDVGKLGLGCKHLLNSTACDANTNCSWCSNALGTPGCYPAIAAQFLPKMIFTCDKVDAPASLVSSADSTPFVGKAGKGCKNLKASAACDDDAECAWCDSDTLAQGCYPLVAAQFLPKKHFTCSKVAGSSVVEAVSELSKLSKACKALNSSADCDANAQCSWCLSTLGSPACVPLVAAEFLPKALFTCDKVDAPEPTAEAQLAAAGLARGSTAHAHVIRADAGLLACKGLDAAGCVAADCVWCSTSLTTGACFTQEHASWLPPGYFKCSAAAAAL